MKKLFLTMLAAVFMLTLTTGCATATKSEPPKGDAQKVAAPAPKATVYFTRKLDAESLLKMYRLVSKDITGKVAIKLHTGEPHGPNILPREWVRLVQKNIPNSAIVECNVLYGSPRQHTDTHRETLKVNGWTFCPVDIMDADGEATLPVKGGLHLKEFLVGKNLLNYDSMVVLTHFKGHTRGGFGGALKNIAIGCGSGRPGGGKDQLHHHTETGGWPGEEPFMERMADGGKAIIDHFGKRITYVNVLRNMSVSCDCEGVHAAPVVTPDIGILASTDILAIDQASVDLVYALAEKDKHDLVERIESRKGLRQLSAMEELGMGSRVYELIDLDKK